MFIVQSREEKKELSLWNDLMEGLGKEEKNVNFSKSVGGGGQPQSNIFTNSVSGEKRLEKQFV